MEPNTRRITTANSPRRIAIEWEDIEPQKHTQPPKRTRGVCWCKTRHKWKAQASYKGKQYMLGRYDAYEDAVEARLNFRANYPAYDF